MTDYGVSNTALLVEGSADSKDMDAVDQKIYNNFMLKTEEKVSSDPHVMDNKGVSIPLSQPINFADSSDRKISILNGVPSSYHGSSQVHLYYPFTNSCDYRSASVSNTVNEAHILSSELPPNSGPSFYPTVYVGQSNSNSIHSSQKIISQGSYTQQGSSHTPTDISVLNSQSSQNMTAFPTLPPSTVMDILNLPLSSTQSQLMPPGTTDASVSSLNLVPNNVVYCPTSMPPGSLQIYPSTVAGGMQNKQFSTGMMSNTRLMSLGTPPPQSGRPLGAVDSQNMSTLLASSEDDGDIINEKALARAEMENPKRRHRRNHMDDQEDQDFVGGDVEWQPGKKKKRKNLQNNIVMSPTLPYFTQSPMNYMGMSMNPNEMMRVNQMNQMNSNSPVGLLMLNVPPSNSAVNGSNTVITKTTTTMSASNEMLQPFIQNSSVKSMESLNVPSAIIASDSGMMSSNVAGGMNMMGSKSSPLLNGTRSQLNVSSPINYGMINQRAGGGDVFQAESMKSAMATPLMVAPPLQQSMPMSNLPPVGSLPRVKYNNFSYEPIDEGESLVQSRPRRQRVAAQKYVESIKDEEFDDSSIEENEQYGSEKGVDRLVDESKPRDDSPVIDKVLEQRTVLIPHDPNKEAIILAPEEAENNYDESEYEKVIEYKIKWQGSSYMHCTWEPFDALINLKGAKKLDNYIKTMEKEIEWKKTATLEEIENYEIEKEMARESYEQHLKVDRIIAIRHPEPSVNDPNPSPEYLCVWCKLLYCDATWEKAEDIKDYQHKIDQFLVHSQQQLMNRIFYGPRTVRPSREIQNQLFLSDTPEFLKGGKLRDYQLQGVNWLFYSWCNGVNCILADEMGLGKTIQTVSFLGFLQFAQNIPGPFIVVVPLSTIPNWEVEFAKWIPDMNTVVYMGDSASRELIREYEFYYVNSAGKKTTKFNTLITSYEIVLKDKQYLSSIKWNFLVVDEAHRLKNADSALHEVLKDFITSGRLLITGTPLQNSLRELWALLNFLEPRRFPSLTDFEERFSNFEKAETLSNLHAQLKPHLLRRMKKDVEKSLPAKNERILRVGMTPLQRKYYKWVLNHNFEELNRGLRRQAQSSLSNILVELKKVCNHPYLFANAEEMAKKAALAQLQESMGDLNVQITNEVALDAMIRCSGKLMLLDKLLIRLKETGHRVLIFSQMVRMLDILSDYVRARGFLFQRLDGRMSRAARQVAMESFNAEGSKDFCFLLSTRAGGLGINLSTADTVIIFDSDWNPQNDLQAESRAHRIGQKNVVNIYRLLVKGTVEETILERAKQKLVLDHVVIQRLNTRSTTGQNQSDQKNSFSKGELASILKFGAAELFKNNEDDQHDSQGNSVGINEKHLADEMDIDEILARAETASDVTNNQENGEFELFSAFKVANFDMNSYDEDEDEVKNDEEDDNFWAKIIPPELRENRVSKNLFTNLGPRRRKKVDYLDWEQINSGGGGGGGVSLRSTRQSRMSTSFEDRDHENGIEVEDRRMVRRTRSSSLGGGGHTEEEVDESVVVLSSSRGKRSSTTAYDYANYEDSAGAGGSESESVIGETKGNHHHHQNRSRGSGGGSSSRGTRNKVIKSDMELDTTEIRRLLMALRAFGDLDRLQEIIEIADLKDKQQEVVLNVINDVIYQCKKVLADSQGLPINSPNLLNPSVTSKTNLTKSTFKFMDVVVNAAVLLQRLNDLSELRASIQSYQDPLQFRITIPVKQWVNFSKVWSNVLDAMLLVGVYRYGVGQWESIAADPKLGLTGKILVPGKPGGAQLAQRVDSLFKQLRDSKDFCKQRPTRRITIKKSGEGDGEDKKPSKSKGDRSRVEYPPELEELVERYWEPMEEELSNLNNSLKSLDSDEKYDSYRKFLLRIRNDIMKASLDLQPVGSCEDSEAPLWTREDVINCLWNYVAGHIVKGNKSGVQLRSMSERLVEGMNLGSIPSEATDGEVQDDCDTIGDEGFKNSDNGDEIAAHSS